jgi:hypothetical protein
VAFFSAKLNPVEINYTIHDKELLAVIRYMTQWDAELRSCRPFMVITDHKNLEYFIKKQDLSERQARWADRLARYCYHLVYCKGSKNIVADALSRWEQDTLGRANHDLRRRQMIPDEALTKWAVEGPRIAPFAVEDVATITLGERNEGEDDDNVGEALETNRETVGATGEAEESAREAQGPAPAPFQDLELNALW